MKFGLFIYFLSIKILRRQFLKTRYVFESIFYGINRNSIITFDNESLFNELSLYGIYDFKMFRWNVEIIQ